VPFEAAFDKAEGFYDLTVAALRLAGEFALSWPQAADKGHRRWLD